MLSNVVILRNNNNKRNILEYVMFEKLDDRYAEAIYIKY